MYIDGRNVNPQRNSMTQRPPGHRVGYGKPPLHSRFRKGRSGNPEGGRRRVKRLAALLEAALDEAVAATAAGDRPITRREAIVASLVEKSAAGDLRATKLLLDLVQKSELAAGPAPGPDPDDDPRAHLLRELARLAAAPDDADAGPPPAEAIGKPSP